MMLSMNMMMKALDKITKIQMQTVHIRWDSLRTKDKKTVNRRIICYVSVERKYPRENLSR